MAVAQGIIAALFGLCVGSFLNVVIVRLPQGGSLLVPARSECPHCHGQLAPGDLIPLLSYFLLRGRCRACGAPISRRYPFVEGLTAALFVLCFLRFGWTLALVASAILCAALVVCLFVDLEHMLVLDEVLLVAGISGVALNAAFSALCDWKDMLLGIAAGALPLLLVALAGRLIFRKTAMGGGDIKFMAMAGAFLGWQNALMAFFFAAVGGCAIVVVLLAMKKIDAKQHIPLIPALSGGVLLALFFGTALLQGYLGWIESLVLGM